jgi:pilus assembly protein Flp/PilA
MTLPLKFTKNESAVTSIEYALIAAVVSVSIVTAVHTLGSGLNASYTSVANALK